MRTKQARNELGQPVTLYWCERCLGWHDLNEDPEPIRSRLSAIPTCRK